MAGMIWDKPPVAVTLTIPTDEVLVWKFRHAKDRHKKWLPREKHPIICHVGAEISRLTSPRAPPKTRTAIYKGWFNHNLKYFVI